MKKLTMILFILLISALALTACGQQAVATISQPTVLPPGAVVAEGHIRPIQASNLAFQARGTVSEVVVKIGDKVKQGDVLARMGETNAALGVPDAAYAAAQAELVNAQQAYDDFTRNMPLNVAHAWRDYMSAQKVRADALYKWNNLDVKDIESRMKDQQNVVDQRQKDLKDAQAEFDKHKDQPVNNFDRSNASDRLVSAQENLDEARRKLESITRERDTVRAALDSAIAAEAEAKRNYDGSISGNVLGGSLAEQLTLLKARLEAAQAQVGVFTITAPFDGVVADVNVHIGDQIGPETSAVSVANLNQWIVETSDVTELEVVKLAVGQPVSMVPDSLPGVTINGTVESISQAFTKQGGDILYTVRIKVDNVDPRIRWGMTVEATFPPLK